MDIRHAGGGGSFVRQPAPQPAKLQPRCRRQVRNRTAARIASATSLIPTPDRELVAMMGRLARTLLASASIGSSLTPTYGARSILFTTSKSHRNSPGPLLRGISSPPATSITKIHQSTRSSEKVDARLSPPDSNRINSRPRNLASRSSPAAIFNVGPSRLTGGGQAPASTADTRKGSIRAERRN